MTPVRPWRSLRQKKLRIQRVPSQITADILPPEGVTFIYRTDNSVPTLIDYPTVLQTLERSLRCVYPNSGAFGIPPGTPNHILGWSASTDPTIRPEMNAALRLIPEPAAHTLAALLTRAWQHHLPGPLWLMPASHWAYELQFGSPDWLPELLNKVNIDPEDLRPRTDGSAIQFDPAEQDTLRPLIETLFSNLIASDFTVAFPNRPIVALLHHHRQIWWQTSDETVWKSLDSMVLV
jgi:hypothetical protein